MDAILYVFLSFSIASAIAYFNVPQCSIQISHVFQRREGGLGGVDKQNSIVTGGPAKFFVGLEEWVEIKLEMTHKMESKRLRAWIIAAG